MRRITSFSMTDKMLKEVDRHPVAREASRSAFIRVCVSEKLEKDRQEKVEKNDKTKE